jgi:hypothetical protein
VETRGRGLREKTTLSLFAAARRASSTRHYDGSRDLRSDCDERLASFFALMVGPKTRTAAKSTYFNVGTQAGDVNFLCVLAAYSVLCSVRHSFPLKIRSSRPLVTVRMSHSCHI